MHVDGETRLIGFFGSTYRTSQMYTMYNAAIRALGLNFIYVPLIVDDLQKAVEGVRHLGIAAVGVTIPYKIEVLPFLDALDEDARRIGAVNAFVNREGKLVGSNSDGRGALRALQEQTEVQGKGVCLLGAGGSARAIAFALHDFGCQLTILNRTVAGAEALAAALGPEVRWGGLERLPDVLPECDILLHATPVGMAGTALAGLSPVPETLLRPGLTVMDIVARPRETPLMQAATRKGCAVVYGYRMLLWQGIYKFNLYTGVEPPIEVMEQAMEGFQ